MRPREREQNQLPSESSPTLSSPPPRPVGNLSSMVVRPSDSSAAACGGELNRRRRGESPSPFRRRGESPVGFRCRDSSSGYQPRPQRFSENQGYLPRAGSISPPRRRARLDNGSNYDDDFEHPDGRRLGQGIRGGRGRGRFHDVSPRNGFGRGAGGYLPRAGSISPPRRRARLDNGRNYDDDFEHLDGRRLGQGILGGRGRGGFHDVSPRNGFGRGAGGRSLGRDYDVDRQVISPFEGEYVHRNDPNLSPREGDWICGNPRCGNLNFARRTNCNHCDQPRYAPGRSGPPPICISPPPRRSGYYTSPPCRSPPPIDHHCGIRRNFSNQYSNRSPPPRGWGATEDPRDYVGITAGSPLRRCAVGRFQDHMRKDCNDDYSRRGGNNWPSDDEFIPQSRGGYDRRPPSPSPRDRWARARSKSPPPPVGRSRLPLKESSLMGRGASGGRDKRRYNDDFYLSRGRANDSDMMGHGSGERYVRRSDDSFVGRGGGRGGAPRGMARGRNHGDMY